MVRALYAGSFDPVTSGHLDLIRRGIALFGELTIAIGRNPAKRPLFTVDERIGLLREVLAAEKLTAQVTAFEGLAVDVARSLGASCLLRGVRSAGDFELELSMAQMNRQLAPQLDTVVVMPSPGCAFISARLVREAGLFGADLTGLVPACIQSKVERKLREGRPHGE